MIRSKDKKTRIIMICKWEIDKDQVWEWLDAWINDFLPENFLLGDIISRIDSVSKRRSWTDDDPDDWWGFIRCEKIDNVYVNKIKDLSWDNNHVASNMDLGDIKEMLTKKEK